ncbi:hypothetical protein TCAL_13805 [Tigriopus californicus]|uniref:Aldehyde dehydrogenase domain-containing protein n=1 Tax=Tigriopus californicus TaxID=6832 RepID=A0A553PJW9_TIGCA|nr:hypothetical protein TCAL_13805 [Tigriopus californicus]|eukprot:TCALIF_13805-PA protein Name:"Similar to ALDH9A1 4-trimethylaminobutyraldehyde dehydrogenase (Homo sapiens)" AED:0.09 eAED:0.09 QI:354/0.8/1/1/1/1/6/433/460
MWGASCARGATSSAGWPGMRAIATDVTHGPWNWLAGQRTTPLDALGNWANIEPRSGRVLASIPMSGPQEVDRAVTTAQAAFPAWSRLSGTERGRFLSAAALKMREHLEDIARLDVIDNGKPIWEARLDMETVIGSLEYYGALAASFNGQHVRMPDGSFALVTREPYGVVGGVGAWNYPLQTCTWKAAPALACGNTFVYKPSQFTPITAVILGEILKEVGVPDGVFNVIQGDGSTGALLTQHPGCSKLSFTGSVPTGIKIMQAGAVGVRNVTLELGGKSPLIVFDDANLKNAVKGALMANFLTQGEVCSNGTRVFVQKGIYGKFLHEFVNQAQKMKAGDPLAEDTTIGATINEEHAQKVLGFIERAKKEGVTVECGGERIQLESGVFTNDLTRAHRVINALEAGTCWINTFNLAPSEVPFGGVKMSGIGRENGTVAMEFYSQMKTIYVEMNDVDCGLLYQD